MLNPVNTASTTPYATSRTAQHARRSLRLFALLPLLWLAGCSTLAPPSAVNPAAQQSLKQHLQQLAQLKQWEAKGKLKITVDKEPNSAAFSWQQFDQNYAINFFGPFGYGSSWLRRTSKGVTLESPEHPTQSATSPEQLLQDTVGWQAPISELQFWLKGQPSPHAILDEIVANSDGAVTLLRQQGWTIELSRHQRVGHYWLPSRLEAKRTGIDVLIVIKEWSAQ
jgi:outer membrane lipoprotein LolB